MLWLLSSGDRQTMFIRLAVSHKITSSRAGRETPGASRGHRTPCPLTCKANGQSHWNTNLQTKKAPNKTFEIKKKWAQTSFISQLGKCRKAHFSCQQWHCEQMICWNNAVQASYINVHPQMHMCIWLWVYLCQPHTFCMLLYKCV